jgi:hypothetical protein
MEGSQVSGDMRLRLAAIVVSAVNPALALLPPKMDSKAARVQLLATGLQESKFTHRCQVLSGGRRGPAHGFWQFEKGGGVVGVMRHAATRHWAAALCQARSCDFDAAEIWGRLETDDVLAAGFARLLVFSDPKPLPGVHDAQAGWDLYMRTWRPGKPHRETWDAHHLTARAEVLS